MSKPFWQSKTIWVNVATVVVGVLTFIVGEEYDFITEETTSIIVTVVGVLNVLLRSYTKTPITTTDETKES